MRFRRVEPRRGSGAARLRSGADLPAARLVIPVNSEDSPMLLDFDDDGPGPVVVLLHGFPLNRTMWEAQTKVGSRYRVIAPDLRGHGHGRPGRDLHDRRDGRRCHRPPQCDAAQGSGRPRRPVDGGGDISPSPWSPATRNGSAPDADGYQGRSRLDRSRPRSRRGWRKRSKPAEVSDRSSRPCCPSSSRK